MASINEMFKARRRGDCPFCGIKVEPESFRDDLSRREFRISGLCQGCQDEVLGGDEPVPVTSEEFNASSSHLSW